MIWYPQKETTMQNMFTILNNAFATTTMDSIHQQYKTRHTNEYTTLHDYFDNK